MGLNTTGQAINGVRSPSTYFLVDGADNMDNGANGAVTTDTVMTNFVSFEPDAPAPTHHHVEQQIAIILSGELTFTVGDETRVMHAGDCVVIPPNVRHGGVAGPEGCKALDVFTPPRAAIVSLMAD